MKRLLWPVCPVLSIVLGAACGGSGSTNSSSSSGSSSGNAGMGGAGGTNASSSSSGDVGSSSSSSNSGSSSSGDVSSSSSGMAGAGGVGGGMAGAGGAGGIGGMGGTGGSGGGTTMQKPPTSPFIVTDQFGYLPNAQKFAIIRDPETGFDAAMAFSPGMAYELVNANTGASVYSGNISSWKNGMVDGSSGDRAWSFDFSSITTPGTYYVHDKTNDVRSYEFRIANDAYRDVLKAAMRSFFYQRAGQDKPAMYAGAGWADGPSHVGPLQDKNCRRYNAPNDATTEKDLSGGWYDAGDYNKYTNWTARYVLELLHSYAENPAAFTDDYNIPESGNGIPDVIDEAKWGMDWLKRMQNANGSVLSIVGVSHASPPSAATGPSAYGNANTSATLTTAAAFAYGSKVFRSLNNAALTTYADDLLNRAQNAWNWANANPSVTFYNNDSGSGTQGLGAGQQETDDYGRLSKKVEAAAYLFETTNNATYRTFVDSNYGQIHLVLWGFAYPFEAEQQDALLYYAKLPGATSNVSQAILTAYKNAMNSNDNFGAMTNETDPYRAYMKDYGWGSNSIKSQQGNMYYNMITFGVDATKNTQSEQAAARFINYLHGTNPLNIVYLSNMFGFGAENSVREFYHSWFTDGSMSWDRVGQSTYGPAPGFLVGGPNPSYDWDGCCPSGCGSTQNNALCMSESITPPKGQPAQKSFKEFNTNWPIDSWSVTENSNGYQVAYIRLLSKFVK